MNVFRLTKRNLVSTSSFSKPKNKRKSSVLMYFSQSFLTKKGHAFDAFFRKYSQTQTSWREDWKPWLISFWISVKRKMSPTVWLIRDTVGILTTHVKATILLFLWRLRYEIALFFKHIRTDLPSILNHIRLKIIRFLVLLRLLLTPILKPIHKKVGLLVAHSVKALSPALIPIHNRIGVLVSQTQVIMSPILVPINNKLAKFTPSVNSRFGQKKESFYSFLRIIWAFFKSKPLAAQLVSVTIIAFCSIAYVKRKDYVMQHQVKYGFNFKNYHVNESDIKKGDAVYSMLIKLGLSYRQADSLLAVVKPRYNFEKIQIGKPYTTLISKGLQNDTAYLVFEPDPKRYFIFDLATPSVKEVKRAVSVREFQKGGMIRETFYNELVKNGISHTLIDKIQEALGDKIDVKQCTDGEAYKLIWEEELIEGQPKGIEKLTCVYFKGLSLREPILVFYYDNAVSSGWYGKGGLPMSGGFMDKPVENSTITSGFSWHRKHPILGYRRPHLGTDYAAPRGTPIRSVADGMVEEARFSLGNGRYVRIKHSPPYETEYLHMSRFAQGIEQGVFVKKKEIIGYVGMSGLTTGPHVCFRLWKDGKAINHLTERFYTEADNVQYKKMVAEKTAELDKIPMLNYSY